MLTRRDEMTEPQRDAWDGILDEMCTGDDAVHINGEAGCAVEKTGDGYRCHCLGPSGSMRIGGLTSQEEKLLPQLG